MINVFKFGRFQLFLVDLLLCTVVLKSIIFNLNQRLVYIKKLSSCICGEVKHFNLVSSRLISVKSAPWSDNRAANNFPGWRRSNRPVKPIFPWTYPIFGRTNVDNNNIWTFKYLNLETLNFFLTSLKTGQIVWPSKDLTGHCLLTSLLCSPAIMNWTSWILALPLTSALIFCDNRVQQLFSITVLLIK